MTEQVTENTPVENVEPVETGVEAVQTPVEEVETGVETPEESESVSTTVDEDTTQSDVAGEPLSVDSIIFDGMEMRLDIPDVAVQMAQDKGFDAKELVAELYEGEFGFSEERYEQLVAAYGKMFVDMSIDNLRMSNEASVRSFRDAEEAGAKEAFEAISPIVGGEEGWEALAAFAETLPAEDVDAFNAAMDSGNPMFQKLAVEALMSRIPKEEAGLSLVEGKGKAISAPTAITVEEYRESMANGEYYKDPAKWDALRRAGQAAGI